jgi:4-hydroxy-tetrahydrodipicolinate synthase
MTEFKRKPIEGVFALMPLCLNENQEIDYEGIRWNIEFLEQKGVHGFIMFGCMGQMNAPSEEEFNKVCDVCVEASRDKKITCVISSTATNTKEVIRRAKYAEDAGADGSMIMLPYALPVTSEWAVEFYQTVDAALNGELAIILYNNPNVAGFNVTPTLWRKYLLRINSLKALKESNMAKNHREATLITVADKINWMSSTDSYFWHESMLGAKGVTAQFVWAAPRLVLKYYEECRRGNHHDAWTITAWKALANAVEAFLTGFDLPVSRYCYEHGVLNALAEIGGAKAGPPRKPYGRLPEKGLRALREAVKPLIEMERKIRVE